MLQCSKTVGDKTVSTVIIEVLHSLQLACVLCSYRVRGVGGSFAEHLTVESYTITVILLLLVFHHPLTLSL